MTEPLGIDLPCSQCGYDFRGATASGLCPDFGLRVVASLDSTRLIFADLDWLRRILASLQVAIVAIVTATMLLLWYAIQFLSFQIPLPHAAPGWTPLAPALMTAVLVPSAVAAVSFWRLSSPAPDAPRDLGRPGLQLSAGIGLVLGAAASAWTIATVPPKDPLAPLGAYAVAFSLQSMFLLAYLSELAGRLPARRAAWTLRILTHLTAAAGAFLVVSWLRLNGRLGWGPWPPWFRDAPINCVVFASVFVLTGVGIGGWSLRFAIRNHVPGPEQSRVVAESARGG